MSQAGNNSKNMIIVLPAVALAGVAALAAFVRSKPIPPPDEPTFAYELWGKTVNLGIPKEKFPTAEEMKEMEDTMPGCKHGWFESTVDGKQLHYREFLPVGTPKAIVVFHHGIQSHSGLSFVTSKGEKLSTGLMVQKYVQEAGFALYAMDQLGHGYSEGRRMFIPDYKHNVADLAEFARLVASLHNDSIPLFVSGHSFGACLVLHVARVFQTNPETAPKSFRGITVVAPAIEGDMPPPPVYHLLRYVLAPKYPTWTPFFMPNPVSADRIWRDPEALRLNTAARKVDMGLDAPGAPFLLGTALQMVLAMEGAKGDVIPALEVPFCAVHGTMDHGVPVAGTDLLANGAQTPPHERAVHRIDGAYHDLFADPAKDECMEHLIKFIESQITI